MAPSPMWILWGWLAGIPIIWAACARWIGAKFTELRDDLQVNWQRRVDELFKEYDGTYTKAYAREKARRDASTASVGAHVSGWVAVAFAVGAIWPLALPIAAMFLRGRKVGDIRTDIKRRMKEAEAEIERIRKQEGWDKS